MFAADARLEVRNRSDRISFPAVTIGQDGIADVLVRRFNQTFENIYSFYLGRPDPDDQPFSCDWLVAMTDKSSRCVRVGCGRYEWTLRRGPAMRLTQLVITIEAMLVLDSTADGEVRRWLAGFDYPWTSAAAVTRSLPLCELDPVGRYLRRQPAQG